MKIGRRNKLPADARSALGISSGERTIAWGIGDDSEPSGSWVVATDQALYEQRTHTRVAWQTVIKGTWEQPDLVIDFESGHGPRRLRIRLEDPQDLPAAVRDRVTDTVVISEHRESADGVGAHFVARRSPGSGIEDIHWTVVFDAGLDAGDPRLREWADDTLQELRASLGI